jgi:transcriptional accessory protein Tex/SPT6
LIPGIGESLGREILAYRQRRKGFRSVEELRNIRGIGGKKYETFKKFFAVNLVRNSSGALNPAGIIKEPNPAVG